MNNKKVYKETQLFVTRANRSIVAQIKKRNKNRLVETNG